MPLVQTSDLGKVRLITMKRPEKLNAINAQAALDLQDAFVAFEASDQRVAVLTGAGDKALSVGNDLKDPPENWRILPNIGFRSDKPVICAVAGLCIGGGLMTAAMSDLVVATESASFSYPEARVGMTGGFGALLSVRIPHKIAMEILLCGTQFTAARAYDAGLVNRVVPDGTHVDVAMNMAAEIAEMAPLVVRTIKRFVAETLPRSPAESMVGAQKELLQILTSKDREEGARAFAERRAPKFTGD